MITDEMVEAAAKAIHECGVAPEHLETLELGWQYANAPGRQVARSYARAALEAAEAARSKRERDNLQTS